MHNRFQLFFHENIRLCDKISYGSLHQLLFLFNVYSHLDLKLVGIKPLVHKIMLTGIPMTL